MKRRQFIKQTASVAGLSFVGCGLGGLTNNAVAQSGDGARRQVMVDGKRMLTVDIHSHSYVHDVLPLLSGHDDLGYLESVLNTPPLQNKLNINNVDFRLDQMDKQGIDMQAVSLHVGQYHHWADRDLAAQIVTIQNEKIAELCGRHPDRFVGLGAVALQHPEGRSRERNWPVRAFIRSGLPPRNSAPSFSFIRETFPRATRASAGMAAWTT